ncbi:MAG: calcium-binding protein [Alphaproteobacteria bacterium HGW-Alphaproteobacteria-6]|nr:MAG: calcium-binding protein [Alphaproteobacteria bacterium HGW-Alphaproteobacteria-6]
MRKLAITLALSLIPAGTLLAATMGELDADADGALTLAELQAGYPTLTEDGFIALDSNADGLVDEAELTAATGAGILSTDG